MQEKGCLVIATWQQGMNASKKIARLFEGMGTKAEITENGVVFGFD